MRAERHSSGGPSRPPQPAPIGRVLLVDDDALVLRAMERLLRGAGHEVCSARGGDEAQQLLGGPRFDALVSDILMPGLSGLELLRRVRERDLDLPIILITGQPTVGSASDAVAYGAFRYLLKPIDEQDLLRTVERAISVGRAARLKREMLEESGSGTFQVSDRAGLDATLTRVVDTMYLDAQPVYRTNDGTVFAQSVVLRSQEPSLRSPAAVWLAAERADRVQEVSRAQRALAIPLLARFPEDCSVFVNLHPQDVHDPLLGSDDSEFVRHSNRFVLELTERGSLDKVQNLRRQVAFIRSFGFRIAIGDLGGGYAGLSSFTQLEPDFAKLDATLVSGIAQDERKQKIVRSMVRLCRDMGVRTIAEGVDSPEGGDLLGELGCDFWQEKPRHFGARRR